MGKKKAPRRSETELEVKRNGEVQVNSEAKRVLEKFLAKSYHSGSTQTLRTIVYESKKLETVRVVLEPAQKLVVVHREPMGCRHLLQTARSKLNKKGLNQCFLRCGGEKKILTNTQDLEDGSRVWFEVVEHVAPTPPPPPVFVEPAIVEESESEEEEEFDQDDDVVDCFDRARAVNHSTNEFPQPTKALPKIDYGANRIARTKLPIDDFELELAEAVLSHSVTILSAPTGSGKSTRLPQFILAHVCGTLKEHCNIIITEPRRIAAITLADRVAQELHGGGVETNRIAYEDCLSGFSVRTASRIGPSTRVLFCTVGVLLKRLSHDNALQGVTHVFVDEAHEQDVLTDLLLIFLRDLLSTTRADIKIVILSATMRSETFAQYFAKFSTKRVAVPGSMFPVDFYHLENLPFLSDVVEHHQQVKEPQLILHCIEYYIQRNKGDDLKTVLIFVCGRKDILETMAKLRARLTNVELLPLHSQLSNEDQRRVFAAAKPGLRRIVVSTNVAETSVTIPNVGLVVDCGKYKESTYDAERRMQELRPVRISTSAMMQRRGRAGRTSHGTCFHLFSNTEVLDDSPVPGMQKDSLESAMVFLKAARRGSNAYQFFSSAPNPPPKLHVQCILEDLTQLGVLQGTFSTEQDFTELTPLGFHLAKLGTTCRVGKLLVFGCLFDCIQPVLTIAAALDGKNPFNSFAMKPAGLHEIRKHFGQDDFTCFLKAREVYLESGPLSPLKRFVSNSAMELNEKIRTDFVLDLIAAGFLSPHQQEHQQEYEMTEEMDKVLHICLAAGLFPHMGKVTQTGVVFSTGQFGLEKSFFDPASTLTRVNKNEFFVYHNRIRLSANSLSLQRICVVSPLALILFAGGLMRSRKQSAKLRFTTFKLGTCWMLRCRNRDASMLLQLRRVVNEALLEIYEHKRSGNNKQHQEMFKVIKSLF